MKNRDIRHYGTWFVQLLLTSPSFQHRSFKLCRMFIHIMKICISQNDTRQEIWYVGPTGSVGYACTISYVLYTIFCGDSLTNHGDLLLDEEY